MKVSFVTCVAFAASASALPSHHYANVAPVAFANGQSASLVPLVSSNNVAEARANRDTRREDRRKEWQEWAHQPGANGVPNGTNFVAQVLDGVSGIVDSALGPLYSVLGSA